MELGDARQDEIILGDCLDVLRQLPDNSVDAVVSDPPYWISFMNKKWDKGLPYDETRKWMKEAYRVLKPGGHAVIFCANRTQHRVFCGAEDEGFEFRDTLLWLYSAGFPKSLDVSKGIDKLKGAKREKIRVEVPKASAGQTLASQQGRREGVAYSDDFNDAARIRTAAKKADREALRQAKGRGFTATSRPFNEPTAATEAAGSIVKSSKKKGTTVRNPSSIRGGHGVEGGDRPFMQKAEEVGYHEIDSMEPVSDEAIQWQGWGTGLKPCVEPIGLFRKPCSEKSVVANVLRWGTGAMNLGECRIGDEIVEFEAKEFYSMNSMGFSGATPGGVRIGRWPGNLMLTHHPDCGPQVVGLLKEEVWQCVMDCAVAQLDATQPIAKGHAPKLTAGPKVKKGAPGNFMDGMSGYPGVDRGDAGGVSRFFLVTQWSEREKEELRFFYSGKAARSDRSSGFRVDNTHACLHPASEVVTESAGLQPIGEIVQGDRVYAADGRFHRVAAVMRDPYDDLLYEIAVMGTPQRTSVTRDHPFLIWRPEKGTGRLHNHIVRGQIDWQQAEDIRRGDYTMTPMLASDDRRLTKREKEWWFIAGLWLAEGSVQKAGHGANRYPCFVLNKNEQHLADRIKARFPKTGVYKHSENGIRVVIFEPALAERYVDLFGTGAAHKGLAAEVWGLPCAARDSLLHGYLTGDGSFVLKYWQASTVSYQLANQLVTLGESVGYRVVFQRNKPAVGTGIGNRKFKHVLPFYSIFFYPPDAKRMRSRTVEAEGVTYTLRYVKEMVAQPYKGDVVNITVEDAHTFQTAVGASHNTVKPVDLMRWLVRLVTPPDGIVLDPFAGSGSTLLAAVIEQRHYFGIERDADSARIICERLNIPAPTLASSLVHVAPSHGPASPATSGAGPDPFPTDDPWDEPLDGLDIDDGPEASSDESPEAGDDGLELDEGY